MAEKYRVNDKGVDLSSDKAKINVNTVDFSNHETIPKGDMEGPQRHRGVKDIDILATIVDKLEGYTVKFEGKNMILAKMEYRYVTPDMIPNSRDDLMQVAKLIQKKYAQIAGKNIVLKLTDESCEPFAFGQGGRQAWSFVHIYELPSSVPSV